MNTRIRAIATYRYVSWAGLVLAAVAGCGGEDAGASWDGYDPWGGSTIGVSTTGDSGAWRPDVDAEEPGSTWYENNWIATEEDNLATFSVDVDTASYTLTRTMLNDGYLPPPSSVRVEEFLNYFDYGYLPPGPDDEHPFAVDFEGGPSAFGDGLFMLRMGLQGRMVSNEDRPPANLVFLLDVSGSTSWDGKLDLVKDALDVLIESLDERDRISIVTYAGSAGVALRPTSGSDHETIRAVIQDLEAAGSTAGGAGIEQAYAFAEANYIDGGINRIILCTDGDFNVGMTGEDVIELAEEKADSGVTITSMMFGATGADEFLEQLANRADGNAFFIGDRTDALRTLGSELFGTLLVIAGDLKVQAVLNRDVVARYRIVGYDNRILEDDEFDDDTVDAAEVGAGHDVTAMLEVELRDTSGMSDEALVAWVQLRYKPVGSDESVLVEYPMQLCDLRPDVASTSPSLRLAMGVAEFAEILRESQHSEGARFDSVLGLLSDVPRSSDVEELEAMVETARALWED